MPSAEPIHTKPINELRDQLSSVIAEIEATGEPVSITRHGRVVAVLGPPQSGVVLGAGARPGVTAPSIHELAWSAGEFDDAIDSPVEPS